MKRDSTRERVRKFFYYLGWTIIVLAPVLFVAETVRLQDLPRIQPWKWILLFGAVAMIYAARNRDDVLRHHVV